MRPDLPLIPGAVPDRCLPRRTAEVGTVEAGRMLGVGPQAIVSRIHRGTCPIPWWYARHRRLRFRREDVEAWRDWRNGGAR